MKKVKRLNLILFILLNVLSIVLLFIFAFNQHHFNTLQSVFLLLSLNIQLLPKIIFKIKLSSIIYIVYDLFLIAHFIFGEILSFYVKYNYFDVLLHLLSATLMCLFGYGLINCKLSENCSKMKATFAFLFGITSEFVWEIIEYSIDEIFLTNMQRYITNSGEVLIGHLAIFDTIKDMSVALIGCVIFLCLLKIKRIQKITCIK